MEFEKNPWRREPEYTVLRQLWPIPAIGSALLLAQQPETHSRFTPPHHNDMFSIHVSRRPVERLSKSQIHYLVESDRESAHVMIGTKLAHYDITSHLGNGGMGEVYQATDTKLGRSVAVKLLPEVFANDADRVARFEREARVLASLNHPNIAAIYGVEESSDRKFLVMELVPGETLAERIARSLSSWPPSHIRLFIGRTD
jgi:serine/threonine protein kinase